MLQNQSFTDPQGQTHTNAVVRIQYAQYQKSWDGFENESLRNDFETNNAIVPTQPSADSSERISLRIEFVYWPSQEDFDNGFRPYLLTHADNKNPSIQYRVNADELSKAKYTGLTLEEKCELYFKDVVLPALQ